MTTLVAWCGVDSRGPSSVYLASDSRISWGKRDKWDGGRKLFAARSHPVLLGYVGDVLFPSLALSRVVDLIDDQLLFNADDNYESKLSKVIAVLSESFHTYPGEQRHPFSIVFCTREGAGMSSTFYLAVVHYDSGEGWKVDWRKLPVESGVIVVLGTGRNSFNLWYKKWSSAVGVDVSRSVFSALCDSVNSGADSQSGGPAQLVGMYRDSGAGKQFGVMNNGGRYILGLSVSAENYNLDGIEWRNELFEICDWRTMQRKLGAQPQPRPKNL